MKEMPASPYVEGRDGGYFLAGSRISLASIAYALARGETIDDVLLDFPAIQSRENLEGAIAFIQAHPEEVAEYLAERERLWTELERQNSPEIIERLRKYDEERGRKTA